MKLTGETTGRVKTNNYGATAQATAVSLIGSTQTESQSYSLTSNQTHATSNWSYNKTFTTTTQNVNYGLSAKLYARIRCYKSYSYWFYSTAAYVATGTTGTWTATGIAP